jgi:peptidoglycan hydrolase-like protein with peptidoglycan-binding domain
LRAAGLYKGPVDGLMDPDTRMAIGRFQEQHGLRRTENLDQPTLAQMINSQATGYGSSAPAASATVPAATPGSVPAPTEAGANMTGQSSQH